jgi:hypothetical protein
VLEGKENQQQKSAQKGKKSAHALCSANSSKHGFHHRSYYAQGND